MAPREKPPTPAEEAQFMLDLLLSVQEVFPGATVNEHLAFGSLAVRCAGHVVGQTGRIPCGRVVDPKRGSLCEQGCRREGRLDP